MAHSKVAANELSWSRLKILRSCAAKRKLSLLTQDLHYQTLLGSCPRPASWLAQLLTRTKLPHLWLQRVWPNVPLGPLGCMQLWDDSGKLGAAKAVASAVVRHAAYVFSGLEATSH